uniref:Tripartite motif-containing protein 5,Tripartite motif-containing protein 5 n=1 Tax=Macaca mulatta TaxID=9544 RepID=UPI00080A7FB0|nr:Chain A, Tripartite motif-containing protein 5,Tripartite motif-containing protein 5 [Macaca mulatta]5K3Q_B Chain B, Tripartite motif-containing protein 5,Tripartite motif-containing protein 5 [Macaca mulatta]5K3Q_C Chain C, Tripartite motif-containing protein 5,Tripartite motif-containing protein 5 [Macaca mulatta]5K3Q_D Chain D, Tripartite motif-containing protein 5,Tripartite motif-containing protein 5 [Macaca mulatta]
GPGVDHCARHGEKLLLFCQEDSKVICWLCERSQEHRGHHTFLMEEVAQEYHVKLQTALEMLRQKGGDPYMRELISELEHRLQGSMMDLLQGVDGIIKRIEN